MDSGVTFRELLDYEELEWRRWHEWFAKHPEAWQVGCDIAGGGTVGGLVLHVFVSALFHADLMNDAPPPNWKKLLAETRSLEDVFAVGLQAQTKLGNFLARASAGDWETVKDLGFDELRPSKRKMFTQVLLHGVHHRAQLAALLRQQKYPDLWVHDLIVTDVMK